MFDPPQAFPRVPLGPFRQGIRMEKRYFGKSGQDRTDITGIRFS